MSSVPLLLALAAGITAPPTEPPPRVRAIVVGNNAALDPTLPTLRYADDDAVRWWQLLGAFSDDVTLLSVRDDETRGTHPEAAAAALPPTRVALERALERVLERLRADDAEGARSAFYFVFSGHGTLAAGEARLHLLDAGFGRADLQEQLLGRSRATWNHLVIDACNSYLFVNARGERVADPLRRHLKTLELPPNTGVLVSTVEAADSHEFELFRAGVFTHEILSAATGAADSSGDGRVTYDEIAGFFAAANEAIATPAHQPRFWARAPQVPGTPPFLDLRHGRFPAFLAFAEGDAGRFWLEDSRGVRYADLHKAADHRLSIALLDRPFYFLRSDTREARLSWERRKDRAELAFEALQFVPAGARARGAAEEAYRVKLFAEPYGSEYQRHFRALVWRDGGTTLGLSAAGGFDVAPAPSLPRPTDARLARGHWAWVSAGLAVGSLAVGAVAWSSAASRAHALSTTPSMTPDADLERIRFESTAATALAVGGMAFGTVSAVLFVTTF